MPIITIQAPHIEDLEIKRCFVQKVTASAAEAYAMPKEKFILVFQDTTPEDVAVGGTLIADR